MIEIVKKWFSRSSDKAKKTRQTSEQTRLEAARLEHLLKQLRGENA